MPPPVLRHRNGTLSIDNAFIQSGAVEETYLTAATVGGSSTALTVANIAGFAVNQILLIEDIGGENAEIVLTHASSAPTGTTVTLTAALVRTHAAGAKVRVVLFNQIELSHATTATGSKTVLTVATTANTNPPSGLGSGLVAIDATERIQSIATTEHTSGYYFARYCNSIQTAFGNYTDACLYGGWTAGAVGYLIERAMRDVGETFSAKVTRLDCYEWINTCLKLIQGKLKRWPEHYTYNAVLGQIQQGSNVVAMPTDAYDQETNKSIIALRAGSGKQLQYLDPGDFDVQMDKVCHTQVTTQASVGATSLAINNSYDFADSGYADVYIANVKYSIKYTAVTRSASAGVLTGVPASGTGSITVIVPAATDVWQNETQGIPLWFTVRNSQIEFWPLADGNDDNNNLYGDYSHVATSVDSDGDLIDLQRYDIVQDYLCWRIEAKARANGVLSTGTYINRRFVPNGWYATFSEKLTDAIKTLPANNTFKIRPALNRIGNTRMNTRKADLQDLAIQDQ